MSGEDLVTVPRGPQDAWHDALSVMRSLAAAVSELRADYPTTLAMLKESLAGIHDRRAALLLLPHLGEDCLLAVAGSLVRISLSHRDALVARQLLGSLPHREVARVVPAAVWELLDEESNDEDTYRRLAELLAHLGLADSLLELSERALNSSDPGIREVGEDFME